MTEYVAARFFADVIAPVMALLNLGTAWAAAAAHTRGYGRRTFLRLFARYVACFVVGIAVPVALAQAGKRWEVWPGHPGFPSGHETFTVSAAMCLVLLHGARRWLLPGVVASALMGWAVVRAGFHHPPEVAGAVVLGVAGAAAVCRRLRPLPPEVLPDEAAKRCTGE
ncbi:MAG TPA: phosphatase PAP2 family protein [Armatimonadaceae bacterium]|nr:phosphatase PAP2 family protein [Armatimonadaceae bacterium]